jgi:hypothetical protein
VIEAPVGGYARKRFARERLAPVRRARRGKPVAGCVRHVSPGPQRPVVESAWRRARIFQNVQRAQRFGSRSRAAKRVSYSPPTPARQGFAGNQVTRKISRVR